MGRLRLESQCETNATSAASGLCLDQAGLAAKLESWRHDPDLCLIWAAFCTTSPLTLADGISLAKTRRSATEALKLLAGAETGKDHNGRPLPEACAAEETEHADAQSQLPTLKVSNFEETAFLFDDWSHADNVSLKPWQSSGFSLIARLAKSVHSEVHFSQSSAGITGVAKVVSKNIANKKKVDSEESVWLNNENIDIQSFEDIRSEIAVLTFLSTCAHCPYLISILGSFEDAFSIYLVTGYCEEGDLFERVAYGDPLAETDKKRYVSELLQGVRHLHQHNVGHRDISLENVLLRKGSCVLSDFGQAVQLTAQDGTVLRYFVEAGKSMYRSPEMHVPRKSHVQVVCPADGRPGMRAVVSHETTRCEVLLPFDAVPGQPCTATPCGYAVAPADLFACGVCAFVLAVGKPPWATALDSDPSFSFIRRHGVANLLQQWKGGARGPPGKSEEATLLAAMLRVDPAQRSTSDECLRNPWLEAVTRNRSKTA
ncbi:Camk2g [Symbiodinium sp. CCMP2456]|nr:Camk2g [Symbiodinium sp. CCMP2456]